MKGHKIWHSRRTVENICLQNFPNNESKHFLLYEAPLLKLLESLCQIYTTYTQKHASKMFFHECHLRVFTTNKFLVNFCVVFSIHRHTSRTILHRTIFQHLFQGKIIIIKFTVYFNT